MNYRIPEQETKPKKVYKVSIEGDTYTIKASVLIARESTHYFNALQNLTTSLDTNFTTQTMESIYDNAISLYEVLLGKKQSKKLLETIDEKYDIETGQAILLQYAMALYFISSGAKQEEIDNIFFEQGNKQEAEQE